MTKRAWMTLAVCALAAACSEDEAGSSFRMTVDGADVPFALAKVEGSVTRQDELYVFFSEAPGDVQSVVAMQVDCGLGAGSFTVSDDVIVQVTAAEGPGDQLNLCTGQGACSDRTTHVQGTLSITELSCGCGGRVAGSLDVEFRGYRATGPNIPEQTLRVSGAFGAGMGGFTFDGNCHCPCPGR